MSVAGPLSLFVCRADDFRQPRARQTDGWIKSEGREAGLQWTPLLPFREKVKVASPLSSLPTAASHVKNSEVSDP